MHRQGGQSCTGLDQPGFDQAGMRQGQAIGGVLRGLDGRQVDVTLQRAPLVIERGGIDDNGGNDRGQAKGDCEQDDEVAALTAGEAAPKTHRPPWRVTEV